MDSVMDSMGTVGCSARRCAIVWQWKEDAGDGTQTVSSCTLQDCPSRPLHTDARRTGNAFVEDTESGS